MLHHIVVGLLGRHVAHHAVRHIAYHAAHQATSHVAHHTAQTVSQGISSPGTLQKAAEAGTPLGGAKAAHELAREHKKNVLREEICDLQSKMRDLQNELDQL
jgi:hypothetical protein